MYRDNNYNSYGNNSGNERAWSSSNRSKGDSFFDKHKWTILIYGSVFVLLVCLYLVFRKRINRWFVPDGQFREDDKKRHSERAKHFAAEIKGSTPNDILAAGAQRSPEDEAKLINLMSKEFASQFLDSARSIMNEDTSKSCAAAMGVLLASDAKVKMNLEQVKGYMELAAMMTKAAGEATGDVAKGIAEVAAAAGKLMGEAQRCTDYRFTPTTEETKTITNDHQEETQISNSGGSYMFGIIGKNKKSSEYRSSKDIITDAATKSTAYTPHCVGNSIDPTVFAALSSSQVLSVVALYKIQSDAWNRIPNVYDFMGLKKD